MGWQHQVCAAVLVLLLGPLPYWLHCHQRTTCCGDFASALLQEFVAPLLVILFQNITLFHDLLSRIEELTIIGDHSTLWTDTSDAIHSHVS